MSPTISSESDPIAHTTKTQDYSNKLLLSPLDFLTANSPNTTTGTCGSGGTTSTVMETKPLHYHSSSVKRVLFKNNSNKVLSPNKYSAFSLAFSPLSLCPSLSLSLSLNIDCMLW